MLADQALDDPAGLGPQRTVPLVARQVGLGRPGRRARLRVTGSSTHSGAQTHSATSGPSSVGHEHLVADPRPQVTGVEVVQAAVPLKADRAHHRHRKTSQTPVESNRVRTMPDVTR